MLEIKLQSNQLFNTLQKKFVYDFEHATSILTILVGALQELQEPKRLEVAASAFSDKGESAFGVFDANYKSLRYSCAQQLGGFAPRDI